MTTPYRALHLSLPLAAFLVMAASARAASAQDQAAAEALFNEAKHFAAEGKWADACPKFAESQRLDPTAGTLLSLGRCFEHVHKSASAWGAYKEAEMVARSAGDHDREAGAARLAKALEPQLAKLAIVVPPAARAPGIEVKRDGALVGEGQWGSALPLDPGEHIVEATAPNRQAWRVSAHVDAAPGTMTVEIPALLEKLPEAAATVTPGFMWSTQRTVGVVLGAVGMVGLGVAAGFTASAASKNSASLRYCLPADVTKCSAPGVALRNQAFDAAHVATGALVAGTAALAGGIVVFLTAPRGAPRKPDDLAVWPQVQPIVGPGLAGLALQGVW